MIKELKKGDKFTFNDIEHKVKKKYRNDDSPLITNSGAMFHDDELLVWVSLFQQKTIKSIR